MEERSVIHSTFVIERSYAATPERVFGAFADPIKKRRWFVEGRAHDVEQYEMDFRVGGQERARFRFKEGTPVAGVVCTNDTSYQDIVPNRRVVFASAMSLGGTVHLGVAGHGGVAAVRGRDRLDSDASGSIFRGRRRSGNAGRGMAQAARAIDRGVSTLVRATLDVAPMNRKKPRYRPCLPRLGRSDAAGNSGEAQPGTGIGLAAGGAARDDPGRSRSTLAGVGGKRPGPNRKARQGTHLPRLNPPGFRWRRNGSASAGRCGNTGLTGWATCWLSRTST